MTPNQELREKLLVKSSTLEMALKFAENSRQARQESAGEFSDAFMSFLIAKVEHAVETIFEYSESEIEKRFLGTLLLCFVAADPLKFVFSNPLSDARRQIQLFRRQIEFYENLRDKDLPPEESKELREFKIDKALGRFDSFYISMQAAFPDISVLGRSIRADVFIWVPSKAEFQLIIECDGYKYHSGKDRFVSDRKRDRELKRNNIDVFRFSGSEIYQNPIECGGEVFRYLTNRAPFYEKTA